MADSALRILVAEKSGPAREKLATLLTSHGLETENAASGPEAGEMLARGGFSALLCSWPVLAQDTLALLKSLRKNPATRHTPIFIPVPAKAEGRLPPEEKLGVTYLHAPFNKDTVNTIRSVIKTHGPAEAAPPPPRPDMDHKEAMATGRDALEKKDFETARQCFEAALHFGDPQPVAHKGMALACQGLGDKKKFLEHISLAAEQFVASGRPDKGEALYAQAMAVEPCAPNPFRVVADSLFAKREYQEAHALYSKALELTPSNTMAQHGLARCLIELGQDNDALELIKALIHGPVHFPEAEAMYEELTGKSVEHHHEVHDQEEAMEISDSDSDSKEDFREKRGAPRIPLADFFARTSLYKANQRVVNISKTGIGFKPHGKDFPVGEVLHLDLESQTGTRIKKLTARVMHTSEALVGCQFQNLSGKQQKQLDKLILAQAPAEEFQLDMDVDFDLKMW